MSNEYYVYVHRRETDGRIFYVGKGKAGRHKQAYGRNSYWQRVAKKHGWTPQKVYSNLTEACAHSIEKMLIYSLRNQLVNITDGGEGVSGLRHTDETRKKMVANRKTVAKFWAGKTMPDDMREKFRIAKLGKPQSPEHAAQSRMAKLGKPQPKSAREITRKIKSRPVLASSGEWFPSAAEAARVLSKRLGVNCSQGNISMCATGIRNHAYGLSWRYIA